MVVMCSSSVASANVNRRNIMDVTCSICDDHWSKHNIPIFYIEYLERHFCYYCIVNFLQACGFLEYYESN